MVTKRYSLFLVGACASTLLAGCTTTPRMVQLDEHNTKIEPLYRVQQPAGTAAGQYAVGRLDLAEGRVDAAITRFYNALKLDPNYVEAYNGLGVAYGHKGRFEEAVTAFRSALASGPASAHVLSNLGFAQLKAGQFDGAWKSLGRSLELDPRNTRTRENIRLLAQLHRIDRAAAPADLATVVKPPESAAPTIDVVRASPAVEAPLQPERVASPAIRALTSAAIREAAHVQPVRSPEVRIVASGFPQGDAQVDIAAQSLADESAAASPTAALIANAQAAAGTLLDDAARASMFDVVLSRSSDATLVQLAANVYELRPAIGTAQTTEALAFAVPLAAAPASARSDVVTSPPRSATARASLAALDGFEVSNGVGVRQLAGRTARQLSRFGAEVARVSDYRSFDRTRTEIHYRSGFLDGAKLVQKNLPVDAKLVRTRELRPDVNVRLVVGRDMVTGQVAWWNEGNEAATVVTVREPAPVPTAIAVPRGVDLHRFVGTIARSDVDDGWRHL